MTETVSSPKHGGQPTIWQVEDDKTYIRADGSEIAGATLIEIACAHCSVCSVQWDCARFAVACEEGFGTWGMPVDDLQWLRRQTSPVRFIERAERRGRPIQFAVRDAKTPA